MIWFLLFSALLAQWQSRLASPATPVDLASLHLNSHRLPSVSQYNYVTCGTVNTPSLHVNYASLAAVAQPDFATWPTSCGVVYLSSQPVISSGVISSTGTSIVLQYKYSRDELLCVRSAVSQLDTSLVSRFRTLGIGCNLPRKRTRRGGRRKQTNQRDYHRQV
jgi:hypothetical protein